MSTTGKMSESMCATEPCTSGRCEPKTPSEAKEKEDCGCPDLKLKVSKKKKQEEEEDCESQCEDDYDEESYYTDDDSAAPFANLHPAGGFQLNLNVSGTFRDLVIQNKPE